MGDRARRSRDRPCASESTGEAAMVAAARGVRAGREGVQESPAGRHVGKAAGVVIVADRQGQEVEGFTGSRVGGREPRQADAQWTSRSVGCRFLARSPGPGDGRRTRRQDRRRGWQARMRASAQDCSWGLSVVSAAASKSSAAQAPHRLRLRASRRRPGMHASRKCGPGSRAIECGTTRPTARADHHGTRRRACVDLVRNVVVPAASIAVSAPRDKRRASSIRPAA